MLVNEFLEESARRFPQKEALICSEGRFTYGELEKLAREFSQGLLKEGISKQDRVVIHLENSVETVVSIFGTLKAGGIFVVINAQVKPQKLEYILNDSGARILVTDAIRHRAAGKILENCPAVKTVVVTGVDRIAKPAKDGGMPRAVPFCDFLHDSIPGETRPGTIDLDLAAIIYTSGSTGFPKGVMSTHLNVVTASKSIIQYLQNRSDDIILNALPLSFDYGLYQILMAFRFGGTVILEKAFIYPHHILNTLVTEKVTGFPIVPTIAAILLKLKGLEKYDFSALRYITNTAQALPEAVVRGMLQAFPGIRIYSMYGLTECKRVSYLPPEKLAVKPSSVGQAMPNVEVFLVDEKDRRLQEPGMVGELVVRGANVMAGYWNKSEETARVFRQHAAYNERRLYTGDLFRMDNEGDLYFIGRKDDIIKTAGERVSPREIENVLYEMEGVTQAAVIAVDDEILGSAIKAYLTVHRPLTEKEVLLFCSKRLEKFMIPKYVEFLKELPKSPHGKIDKKKLKKTEQVV
jgi:amino acid adenylation domain-containing protein